MLLSFLLQGEEADEARERPAWMNEGGEEAEGESAALSRRGGSGAAAHPPALGLPGSAPGTARANGGAPTDLLDLLGESLADCVSVCVYRCRWVGEWVGLG